MKLLILISILFATFSTFAESKNKDDRLGNILLELGMVTEGIVGSTLFLNTLWTTKPKSLVNAEFDYWTARDTFSITEKSARMEQLVDELEALRTSGANEERITALEKRIGYFQQSRVLEDSVKIERLKTTIAKLNYETEQFAEYLKKSKKIRWIKRVSGALLVIDVADRVFFWKDSKELALLLPLGALSNSVIKLASQEQTSNVHFVSIDFDRQ